MSSIMLNLSLEEIKILGIMVSSFIECDEDYKTQLNLEEEEEEGEKEVDDELKVLYGLSEKLSKITELQNVV